MPLKPPSSAIMRIMRMIVPSDIEVSPQPEGLFALSLPQKTNGNHESSDFRAAIMHAALLFASTGITCRWIKSRSLAMSAPLVVSIPHSLGREEAMRRLKTGLTRAAASVPVLKVDEERWEDNRMIFRVRALGQVAAGHLDVDDTQVRLEVTLPWLLERFAEVGQVAIRQRGTLRLAKAGWL